MASRLEQLIHRRMDEMGFKSIREVERRADLKVDSLRNYLSGRTKSLRSDKIEKLASVLHLNVIDLVGSESYKPSKPGGKWEALRIRSGINPAAPVVGSIFSEGSFVADIMPNSSSDYYAEIDDDSMLPTIRRGDFALIRKCKKASGTGKIYILSDDDGGFSARRIVSRIGKKTVDVVADNREFPSENGISASELRVVGHVLAVIKRL